MKTIVFLTLLLLLAGCAGQGAASDPADTVERYLQAKVDGNEDTIRELICAEMERDIAREVAAFSTVTEKSIEDMACTHNESAGTVTCTGQIVATYGTEATRFPLSTYRVVQEDTDWKWCGEAE